MSPCAVQGRIVPGFGCSLVFAVSDMSRTPWLGLLQGSGGRLPGSERRLRLGAHALQLVLQLDDPRRIVVEVVRRELVLELLAPCVEPCDARLGVGERALPAAQL